MKFERLRLSGFKTFVEPVEIAIAPGLTGIVGPNGCGKSNLVEALRWAMGETSSKSLRGAGMEDVIFAGSATRAARNQAEVFLRIGEPPADLPGHLAGADVLEISRKIVREQGSTYRINGREVRARDVQILFADAASGARSPSLVRQGQIAELIAAKPQHRRRILEDAAGIAGLHARRHEAELRLKGAEENLSRLADILTQYERQRGDLKRQARQAERYKALGTQIRDVDIALLAAGYAAASAEAAEAEKARDTAVRAEGGALAAQGDAERARAVAEHEADAARRALAEAQAQLARLTSERATLDSDLAHARQRLDELGQRRAEAKRDAELAEQTAHDAVQALERLNGEQASLAAEVSSATRDGAVLRARLEQSLSTREAAEAAFAAVQRDVMQAEASRTALERRLQDASARLARLEAAEGTLEREMAAFCDKDSPLAALASLEAALAQTLTQVEAALEAHRRAEQGVEAARGREQAARPPLAEAERAAQRLETELRTIRKLVDNAAPGLWTPAVDRIDVAPGFERALAAALGEDLEAAIEPGAPRHWAELAPAALPSLPEGAMPLLSHVQAPGALTARLSQIGVVAAEAGEALAARLKPGQRLVSREGDLWRWDGYSSRAEAPSPAARRLAERNRLSELEFEAEKAGRKREAARQASAEATRALRLAQEAEAGTKEALRRAEQAREQAAQTLARARTTHESALMRQQAALARRGALRDECEAARRDKDEAAREVEAMPVPPPAGSALRAASDALDSARRDEQDARGALSRHDGTLAGLHSRLQAVIGEIEAWTQRKARAQTGMEAFAARLTRLEAEEDALAPVPDALATRRLALSDDIDTASRGTSDANEQTVRAEGALRTAAEAARCAATALADARAQSARLEVLLENAKARLAEIRTAVEMRIEAPVSSLPPPRETDDPRMLQIRLDDLRQERERLGAVNLRAEIELCEIEKDHARLTTEKGDVEKAITKLRRAIEHLNVEGRARLSAAFERVDSAFQRLFSRLFGGGTARLHLVEAEDPLEAGLDILAHPPGKKPQLLSLLSGGEQALTATALIFAVFLSNPSPICVLDEVDAPLDDANVERLCDLLADMARETQTRFLVITHNPISMARMDRLYGVTMIERGVSQVVSVDLVTAEGLAEAG